VDLFFPEEDVVAPSMHAPENLARVEKFQQKLRELAPRNDVQRLVQSDALALGRELAKARWMVIQPGAGAIPAPFLTVLVLWLGILLGGFGLVSVNSRTAIATIFVCALSVSGAIFLIEDIAHPLEGIMQIAREPAQTALDQLGH
jgi:hypothetical protein